MDKDVSKAVGGFLFAAFMFAAVILLLTYPIMWAMNYAFSPMAEKNVLQEGKK